jgi:hypothetical protein
MSGIVNSTGARSGVIGTTVGAPASKIIQVAHAQDNNPSSVSTTSESWVTSGLSVEITDLVSTSKVLLLWNSGVGVGAGGETHRQIYRGVTALGAGGYGMSVISSSLFRPWSMTWVDEGHSGGTHTYSIYHKCDGADQTSYICWGTSMWNFTAIEIGA